MNEKFITRNLNKDGVLLCSINNSMKGVKIINKIVIYRDLINYRKKYKDYETGYYNIHV